MDFNNWLQINSNLSTSSIYKYTRAIITISTEMITEGIINKEITEMGFYELDKAIGKIFLCTSFIKKNTIGNSMYSNALKWFRSYKENLDLFDPSLVNEEKNINSSTTLTVTEKEAIIKARVGQGLFRDNLLKKYNSQCIITGITMPKLLIASHIKPWAVSSNSERINTQNGLILSSTYDKLFDSGCISFDTNGKILISRCLDTYNREKLKLKKDQIYDIKFNFEMKDFLEYHNDIIFLK